VRIDDAKLQRYLDLYANDTSITMDERQLAALDRLFEIGWRHGEYPCPIQAHHHLLPTPYKKLRLS
jgi:1,4-dihydroxy-6-naphthoate synthase